MKPLLYTIPLKPGMRSAYEDFTSEITGPRKKEYDDLRQKSGTKNSRTKSTHLFSMKQMKVL